MNRTKKHYIMKTKLHTAALITLIALFNTNLFASEFDFNDESYINDIPFDTEMVSCGDTGTSYQDTHEASAVTKAFRDVAGRMSALVSG